MVTGADLQKRWDDLLFVVRRSHRYHQYRRSFFDQIDRFSNIASLVFGSAALVAALKASQDVIVWTSAGVAFISITNLVFGSAIRAREHSDFVRKYVGLEERMLLPPTEELLLSIRASRLRIEAEERPVLHVLNCICHNDQLRADDGDLDQYVTIGPVQRFCSPLFDVCAYSLKKKRDDTA